MKKKSETSETELSKVEFKVNSCVEELAKMDQFAKVIAATKKKPSPSPSS